MPPMSNPIRIAVAGAAGRMGQRLVALTADRPGLQLVGAFDHAAHAALGQDSGQLAGSGANGVLLSDGPVDDADVLIDFTLPDATASIAAHCQKTETALVLGTTGLSINDQTAVDDATKAVAVCQATNFSLVVNVLNLLAAKAANLLGDEYDIEIVEAHHKFKKDAPSGTALTLARAICDATGRDFDQDVVFARHGHDAQRTPRQIAVQALRLGDVVGEHTAMYAAPGERLELKHIGTSRDSYANGALRAAQWLSGKSPGHYSMKDVLGLD
jgi:4-hydroxy-tetrahydrodipicolinate reductase